jgi:hypothetical protein
MPRNSSGTDRAGDLAPSCQFETSLLPSREPAARCRVNKSRAPRGGQMISADLSSWISVCRLIPRRLEAKESEELPNREPRAEVDGHVVDDAVEQVLFGRDQLSDALFDRAEYVYLKTVTG